MGGCQNYGPFLGTLNIKGRIIIGTQKGTIILTTTHIGFKDKGLGFPQIGSLDNWVIRGVPQGKYPNNGESNGKENGK